MIKPQRKGQGSTSGHHVKLQRLGVSSPLLLASEAHFKPRGGGKGGATQSPWGIALLHPKRSLRSKLRGTTTVRWQRGEGQCVGGAVPVAARWGGQVGRLVGRLGRGGARLSVVGRGPSPSPAPALSAWPVASAACRACPAAAAAWPAAPPWGPAPH